MRSSAFSCSLSCTIGPTQSGRLRIPVQTADTRALLELG